MAKSNLPPDTLPRDQLHDLLSVLIALPEGTAEGGRLQLEIADSRLNEIRIEYFSLSAEDGSAGYLREVPLDDALSLLIAATRTALAAANREAGNRSYTTRNVASLESVYADEEISGAKEDGSATILALGSAKTIGRNLLRQDSDESDRLLRRLNDAFGLARQAKVEVGWSEVAVLLIRRLVEALRKTPDLIRSAARAIDVAADLVEPFYDQWKEFEEDIEKTVRKNIPAFTENLRRVADRLERKRGTERMIYVEDEDNVRSYTERVLRHSGWQVYSTGSAKEAIEMARSRKFDLLISDVVMPDIDGPALAAELRSIHQRIKILFISGYSEKNIRKDVYGMDYSFLPKPYSADQLNDAVEHALSM